MVAARGDSQGPRAGIPPKGRSIIRVPNGDSRETMVYTCRICRLREEYTD